MGRALVGQRRKSSALVFLGSVTRRVPETHSTRHSEVQVGSEGLHPLPIPFDTLNSPSERPPNPTTHRS